ncbi:uncharacterized protein TRUGW13939_08073 [Talaromyces rugulosus]|uniref:Uncharacterized protein n=1 Tax=Talaromyces rugulosus TaxID=121627 RepID=A0A7H8R3Z0_TALRU|nr:uncharacterized protein TRUGW13939_08073 [Talaromyces rugulosus]QKX60927.1 hypothetical protein TRUGW13939_08073 [Talaromyces rugulosus]
MGAGSEVNQKQFVAFRAYWTPDREAQDLEDDMAQFGLADTWLDAKQVVDADQELCRYMQLIESNTLVETVSKSDPIWLGSFKPVKVAQELVSKVNGVYDWDRNLDDSRPVTRQRPTLLKVNLYPEPATHEYTATDYWENNLLLQRMKKRRVIISQDRHQLFITMATYDDAYAKYLAGETPPKSYLKLASYGPYKITDHKHMYCFAHAVVALAMAADDVLS